MLTIREPVKLHNMTPKLTGLDSFSERIVSNYSQITADITAKDLMHMVTMPADVYVAEGDNANYFFSDVHIENKQSQKIDIITNLINRIRLSSADELTYQDKVYIENTLRKLGIKNETVFLNEIYKKLEESNDINKLTNLTLNNVDLSDTVNKTVSIENRLKNIENHISSGDINLSNNVKNVVLTHVKSLTQNINPADTEGQLRPDMGQSISVNRTTVTKNIDFGDEVVNTSVRDEKTEIKLENIVLNETIAKRFYEEILDKTDIANDINIINSFNQSVYKNSSISNKEISLATLNTLVNDINISRAKREGLLPLSLTFSQENVFENQPNFNNVTEEDITSQMISAVLYSIINEVNSASVFRNENNTNKWYQVTDALFNSSEDTINRFETNLISPITVPKAVTEYYNNNTVLEDNSIITNVNDESENILNQFKTDSTFNIENQRITNTESVVNDARKTVLESIADQREYVNRLNTEREIIETLDSFESAETENVTVPVLSEEKIIEELSIINKQNDERVKLLNEFRTEQQNFYQNNRIEAPVITKKSAREEALEALNNPKDYKEKLRIERERIREKNEALIAQRDAAIPTALKDRMVLLKALMDKGEDGELDLEGQKAALNVLNEIRNERKISRDAYNSFVENNTVNHITNVDESVINHIDVAELNKQALSVKPEAAVLQNENFALNNIDTAERQRVLRQVLNNIDGPEVLSGDAALRELENLVSKPKAIAPSVTNEITRQAKKLDFVHKITEQISEENIIDRLEEQKQLINNVSANKREVKNVVNETVSEETTRNIVRHEISNINITEQIDHQVSRQINNLEHTIFTKLEGKLKSERQRRGL